MMKWLRSLGRVLREKRAKEAPPLHATLDATDEESGLAIEVASYLGDLAQKSFDRQTDLDESIWRSLPFFAAALAIAVPLSLKVADGLPQLSWHPAALSANILFWLSIASFVWTLRWFWDVLRPRNYEYPADDGDIRAYAERAADFYQSAGLEGVLLDKRLLLDLKLFMGKHLGDAARVNLIHNAAKLKARSQLLLFIITGFALVILAEGITFVADIGTAGRDRNAPAAAIAKDVGAQANAAQPESDSGGGGLHATELEARNQEQVMAKEGPDKPSQAQPVRPPPPVPQLVRKEEQGSPKPGTKPK